MNEGVKIFLVSLSVLMLIVDSLQVLFFIKNTKKENAKIITDKLSLYSIFIISFLFIGYVIDFALEIGTMNNTQITAYMLACGLLSISLNMLLSHNVFALSAHKLLVNNNKYDIDQLHVKSIKKCFYHRILIKANNGISLRLNENNFKKYQTLFSQKSA